MQSSACIINCSPWTPHSALCSRWFECSKIINYSPWTLQAPWLPQALHRHITRLPDVAKHSKTPTSSPSTSLRPVGQNLNF